MARRWWIACVWIVAACGEHGGPGAKSEGSATVTAPPPPAKSTTPGVAHPSMFGDVPIADGEIAVMDGGIHGIQGHTVRLSLAGDAKWQRRLDSFESSGKAGDGALPLAADDAKHLRAWADQVWALGERAYNQPIENGVPRWVWAIVLRRGDEIRVVSGGSMNPTDGAPEPAAHVLGWMIERVDAAAK